MRRAGWPQSGRRARDPVANQLRAGDHGSCDNNCFANPVRADVMMDGRKIAGAAQRRTRRGLLQQGSIQGFAMKTDLAQKFAQALSANCSEFKANEEIFRRAREFAQQKYGTESWQRRRLKAVGRLVATSRIRDGEFARQVLSQRNEARVLA